jgi:hypothetical protein
VRHLVANLGASLALAARFPFQPSDRNFQPRKRPSARQPMAPSTSFSQRALKASPVLGASQPRSSKSGGESQGFGQSLHVARGLTPVTRWLWSSAAVSPPAPAPNNFPRRFAAPRGRSLTLFYKIAVRGRGAALRLPAPATACRWFIKSWRFTGPRYARFPSEHEEIEISAARRERPSSSSRIRANERSPPRSRTSLRRRVGRRSERPC